MNTSQLQKPVPCDRSKSIISGEAEAFACENDFLPGDRIEPLVGRLGGRIHYLDALDSVEARDGSLVVLGPHDFDIFVSAFTGAERDRFTIAHELGHYVLHSNQGQIQIQAERFGSTRVEWEANWFAAAFLMPHTEFAHAMGRFEGNIRAVAAHFLVSVKAAETRKLTLGL